jgi:hypothetical protein
MRNGILRANGEEDVELHTGVLWDTQHSVIYDSSFPILFEIPLPTNNWKPPKNVLKQQGRTRFSPYFSDLHSASTELDKLVSNLIFNLEQSVPTKVAKRGIDSIGDFLHYCCSVISENTLGSMVVSQSEFENALKKFQAGLGEKFNLIANDHENIENFARATSKNFEKFNSSLGALSYALQEIASRQSEEEEEIGLHTVDILQMVFFHFFKLVSVVEEHSVLRQCADRHLPRELINVDQLSARLGKIQKEAARENKKLAVPLSNVHEYFTLSTAACIFSPEKLLVKFSVPLVSANPTWKLVTWTQFLSHGMSHDARFCCRRGASWYPHSAQ